MVRSWGCWRLGCRERPCERALAMNREATTYGRYSEDNERLIVRKLRLEEPVP